MGILENMALQEIGMNIITEDHLVLSEHQRIVLKIYIARQMRMDVEDLTEEIFNSWVSCQEDYNKIKEDANWFYECLDVNYCIGPSKELASIVHRVARFS